MENDTNQKIRSDLHQAISDLVHKALMIEPSHMNGLIWNTDQFDVFLDRQAEITRRECADLAQSCEAGQWISVAEAAEILGVHRNRVLQLVNDGALDAHKVGQRWNISRQSVESRAANPPKAGRRW